MRHFEVPFGRRAWREVRCGEAEFQHLRAGHLKVHHVLTVEENNPNEGNGQVTGGERSRTRRGVRVTLKSVVYDSRHLVRIDRLLARGTATL